ncbi:MAG TPA: YCF48-related protein, partial [Ignavibacteria bacterium]|nr:YCF48-related protein [Ignavibacteria bacterium]
YINTNEGFLLTKNGELLKTEDAGKNWNIKLTSEQNELFDIDFSDTSLGMIVGEKGKIYRTTNKGASWELIHCDNISNLNKIYFTKSNDIYIAGDNGLVLYSSNKGNNWFKIETNSNENISSIKFLNKDFGVAIGKNGKIFISSIGEKVFEAHPVLNPKSDIGNNTSNKFDLMNYPNPFNPTTKISFNLPMNSYVRLAVYNIIGQEVKVLINGRMTSGYKEIQFDGSSLSSGVYFYRLYVRDENNNNYSVTNKFLLIK